MATSQLAISFITLGGLLIAGLGLQWLGRRTIIPRVTFLILLGIAVGPTGFDWIGPTAEQSFPWISHITLALVGFLLGGKLHRRLLAQQGRIIIAVSLWVSLVTWLCVTAAAGLITSNWALAFLLGAVATATDPAAVRDVIREANSPSRFGDLTQGIVALDDVWGLLLFSLSLVAAGFLSDASASGALHGLWELTGSLLLGAGLGIPIAWLTGRSSSGEPLLIEAVGAVLLCTGLAELLQVSYLLACMTMGATVTNLARHHNRPFHAISQIEWPFMMWFFILAGASLDIDRLNHLGWLGMGYVAARIAGRYLGGWICSLRQGWPARRGMDLGQALLPQAGVAIGIALAASQLFPALADPLLATAIAATVVFELIGPPLTRLSLGRQPNHREDSP